MASIFGLKLKGRRTFEGRDWQGNQGNLYLGNKKIAWFNDSGDGGPADIEFYNGRPGREQYEPQLEEIVKKYYEKYPLQGEYAKLTPDIELMMGNLLELMDDEKQYKEYARKGYPIMLTYRTTPNSVSYYGAYRTKQEANTDIENKKLIVLNCFESLKDFDIK